MTAPIPLRTALRVAPNNLPAQYTSFVGRERDRAEIVHLLGGQARLVTLTGAGGIGKTRLAQEAATELLADFGDGIWLVELAPLADGSRVPRAVAAVLGVQEEPGRELLETLSAALRPRHLLLVLDNCEHLLEASAQLVMRVLGGCPRVAILATSREPLGLAGEVTWRVPSLDRPDAHPDVPLECLLRIDSMRLFAERASAAAPGFQAAENVAAMVQICQRLDGIPLALELAAARVSALGTHQFAAPLDDCFRVLGVGSSAVPGRQTDAARGDRLELRPAGRWRASPAGATVRVRGRLDARSGRIVVRVRRAGGVGHRRLAESPGRPVAGRCRR